MRTDNSPTDDFVEDPAWTQIFNLARQTPAPPSPLASVEHVPQRRLRRYRGSLAFSDTDLPLARADKAHIVSCAECLQALSAGAGAPAKDPGFFAWLDRVRAAGVAGAPQCQASQLEYNAGPGALGEEGAETGEGATIVSSGDFEFFLLDNPRAAGQGVRVVVTMRSSLRPARVKVKLHAGDREVPADVEMAEEEGQWIGRGRADGVALKEIEAVEADWES